MLPFLTVQTHLVQKQQIHNCRDNLRYFLLKCLNNQVGYTGMHL